MRSNQPQLKDHLMGKLLAKEERMVERDNPKVLANLTITGERFQGLKTIEVAGVATKVVVAVATTNQVIQVGATSDSQVKEQQNRSD